MPSERYGRGASTSVSAGRVPARLIQRTLLLPSLRCGPLSGSGSHGKQVHRCECSVSALPAVLSLRALLQTKGTAARDCGCTAWRSQDSEASWLVTSDYVNAGNGVATGSSKRPPAPRWLGDSRSRRWPRRGDGGCACGHRSAEE